MYPTFRNGREGWGTLGMGVRVNSRSLDCGRWGDFRSGHLGDQE